MNSRNSGLRSVCIHDKWTVIRKIGSGSFGDIYLGIDKRTGDEVAIKMEEKSARHPQLYFESKVYACLQKASNGVPRMLHFGSDNTNRHNAMVLELLGPSLEDLFNYCSRKFSMKTMLMLADQMLRRVSVVHKCNFIHRDIKPDNFLMGLGRNCNVVFLVDYGLAKKYADRKTMRHMPFSTNKTLTGTARYASVRAHEGVEVSRRDDMESLGYVWIYFVKGSLPWQGTKGVTKSQKYSQIHERKSRTPVTELCAGLPKEMEEYIRACRQMDFEAAPKYEHWLEAFGNLRRSLDPSDDWVFDWTAKRQNATCVQNSAMGQHNAGPRRSGFAIS